MLEKLEVFYSCKLSSEPHKQCKFMPISISSRNLLKYALTTKEVQTIMKQQLIKIFDARFLAWFMDVTQIEKTGENFHLIYDVIQIKKSGENFHLIYDVKGRYTIHRTNCALFVKSRLDSRMSPTCTPPMSTLFATPISSGWTSTLVKSWIPST